MKLRDRIKSLRRVAASELRANPKNWRIHGAEQRAALSGVLERIGYAGAALARETPDGLELIDGHLRADMAGDEKIPVLVVDLDDAEADLLLATLDPIAAMAGRDDAQLRALADGMAESDRALAQLAFDAIDLSTLAEPVTETAKDDDEIPELPAEPVTKAGDLWRLGEHHWLLCGDCRDEENQFRLFQGSRAMLALTSPPYADRRKYDPASGFRPVPPDRYVEWFADVAAAIAANLFDCGSFFLNIKEHCHDGQRELYVKDLTLAMVRQWGWRLVDEFCWTHEGTPKAPRGRFKNGWEPVYQFTRAEDFTFRPDAVTIDSGRVPTETQSKGPGEGVGGRQGIVGLSSAVQDDPSKLTTGQAYPSNVLRIGKNREALGHSAAFPVALPEFFVRAYSDPGDTVFDPFAGSGSTLIAAQKHGRRFLGMDISPAYVDLIIARWEKYTGGKAELQKLQTSGSHGKIKRTTDKQAQAGTKKRTRKAAEGGGGPPKQAKAPARTSTRRPS